LTALGSASSVAAAPATVPASVDVAGAQSTVACLTATLCVLGGSTNRRAGDLVSFHRGGRHRSHVLSGLRSVLDVSCPSGAGCVALGYPDDVGFFGLHSAGVAATLTEVDRSGAPTRTVPLQLPADVTFGRLACTPLANCELAGLNDLTRPVKIVLGHWNGRRLTCMRSTLPPAGRIRRLAAWHVRAGHANSSRQQCGGSGRWGSSSRSTEVTGQ
jgi:hypothetical protein